MDTHPTRRQWLWISSIWLGFGVVAATETVLVMHAAGMHHAWAALFFTSVACWLPWALATPLIQRLVQRFPPVHLRPLVTWPAHLALCAVICFSYAVWNTALDLTFNPYAVTRVPPFRALWLDYYTDHILSTLVIYAAVVAILYVLDSKARLARQQTETAQLNEQLSLAQLNALRRQVEPHFLFNTLNAISALVRERRNDDAVTSIAALSDLLRRVLDGSARQQVTLAEEMAFAKKYLDLQKVRFTDRLQLHVDVPSDLLPAQVPTLLLQLMVENAIKHGIARRAHGGAIRIRASQANGTLHLSVYNDGPAITPGAATGIGLTTMRTRLQTLYGEAFSLDLHDQPPSGVEVSVSLPLREQPAHN